METGVAAVVQDACPCPIGEFRAHALALEETMKMMADDGRIEPGDYPLTHYFVPSLSSGGGGLYAREIHLPAGHVVVGKLHREAHLTIVLQGSLSVVTEHGLCEVEAPCTFVTPAGTKRVAYIHTPTIWMTVHITPITGADRLDEIEALLIAPSYEALGSQHCDAIPIGEKGENT